MFCFFFYIVKLQKFYVSSKISTFFIIKAKLYIEIRKQFVITYFFMFHNNYIINCNVNFISKKNSDCNLSIFNKYFFYFTMLFSPVSENVNQSIQLIFFIIIYFAHFKRAYSLLLLKIGKTVPHFLGVPPAVPPRVSPSTVSYSSYLHFY